jgi:hypothetical protein
MEDCIDKEIHLKWCLAFNGLNPQPKRCEVLLTEFDRCCNRLKGVKPFTIGYE